MSRKKVNNSNSKGRKEVSGQVKDGRVMAKKMRKEINRRIDKCIEWLIAIRKSPSSAKIAGELHFLSYEISQIGKAILNIAINNVIEDIKKDMVNSNIKSTGK